MAANELDIYNLALSAVGVRQTVASVDENSPEAQTCKLWYNSAVEKVLRAAPWPSAKKTDYLALFAERDEAGVWAIGQPSPPWRFAYAYPSDMIRPQYLIGYRRFETGQTDSRRSILTDVESAILVYTMKQMDVARWDSELRMAIVYALAAHIAMKLTGKLERVRTNAELANINITDARISAANQDETRLDFVPDWLEARGYSQYSRPTFVFPHGPILSLGEFRGN